MCTMCLDCITFFYPYSVGFVLLVLCIVLVTIKLGIYCIGCGLHLELLFFKMFLSHGLLPKTTHAGALMDTSRDMRQQYKQWLLGAHITIIIGPPDF